MIDPCQVTSFEVTMTDAPLSYSVNTPMTTGGHYSFLQTPNCGYEQIISVTGLANFMTHNSEAKSFSVWTSDSDDEETYEVRVESTIEVPIDWTRANYQPVQSSATLQIVV